MASYTVREAVAAFRRAPLLTGLSTAMVGLALYVVGLFGLAAYNLQLALTTIEERIEVVAYMRDGTSEREIDAIVSELSDFPEVDAVRYMTKEEALQNARREMPEFADGMAELDTNPLPASLQISLTPDSRSPETVNELAEDVSVLPFVEDVRYAPEWVERLHLLRRIAAVTTSVIGGAFAVVAALIIGAAIRIAIFARRREIQIMRLVGATHGFIRRPFLLEGAITGLLGALLAVGLTWLSFWSVERVLRFDIDWIPLPWILLGIAGGVSFGVLASGLAVRRHLREV